MQLSFNSVSEFIHSIFDLCESVQVNICNIHQWIFVLPLNPNTGSHIHTSYITSACMI